MVSHGRTFVWLCFPPVLLLFVNPALCLQTSFWEVKNEIVDSSLLHFVLLDLAYGSILMGSFGTPICSVAQTPACGKFASFALMVEEPALHLPGPSSTFASALCPPLSHMHALQESYHDPLHTLWFFCSCSLDKFFKFRYQFCFLILSLLFLGNIYSFQNPSSSTLYVLQLEGDHGHIHNQPGCHLLGRTKDSTRAFPLETTLQTDPFVLEFRCL